MARTKIPSCIKSVLINDASFENTIYEPRCINFLYGRNGVGKSTIARAILNKDNATWKEGLNKDDYNILVYNQDFVDKNFRTYKNLPGVFTIGKESVEAQNTIEEKTSRVKDLLNELDVKRVLKEKNDANLASLKKSYENSCWDVTKDYREKYSLIFIGYSKNKSKFAEKLNSISVQEEVDEEKIHNIYDTAFVNIPKTYTAFNKIGQEHTNEFTTIAELLNKNFISSSDEPFTKFIKSLNAFDWVKTGHEHFKDNTEGKCPYCQRELPDDFEVNIKKCFDESYQKEIDELEEILKTYSLETANDISMAENNLVTELDYDFSNYKYYLDIIKSKVQRNAFIIKEKLENPAKAVSIVSIDEDIKMLNDEIEIINKIIKGKNDIAADIDTKKVECEEGVWINTKNKTNSSYDVYTNEVTQVENENTILINDIKTISENISTLKEEIAELRKVGVNVFQTVDKINTLLRDSGFQGFHVEESEEIPNSYVVIRNKTNKPAERLSEGERNFISFIYFYCLVRGQMMN